MDMSASARTPSAPAPYSETALRRQEREITRLTKDNFNLQLQLAHFEDRLAAADPPPPNARDKVKSTRSEELLLEKQDEVDSLRQKLDNTNDNLTEALRALDMLAHETRGSRGSDSNAIQEDNQSHLGAKQEEIDSLRQELEDTTNDLAEARRTIETLESEGQKSSCPTCDSARADREDMLLEVNSLRQELQDKDRDLFDARRAIEMFESEASEAHKLRGSETSSDRNEQTSPVTMVRDMRKEMADLESEKAQADQFVEEILKERDSLQQVAKEWETRWVQLNEQYNTAARELEVTKAVANEAASIGHDLEKETDSLKSQLRELEDNYDNVCVSASHSTEELNNVRQRNETLESERQVLEDECDAARESQVQTTREMSAELADLRDHTALVRSELDRAMDSVAKLTHERNQLFSSREQEEQRHAEALQGLEGERDAAFSELSSLTVRFAQLEQNRQDCETQGSDWDEERAVLQGEIDDEHNRAEQAKEFGTRMAKLAEKLEIELGEAREEVENLVKSNTHYQTKLDEAQNTIEENGKVLDSIIQLEDGEVAENTELVEKYEFQVMELRQSLEQRESEHHQFAAQLKQLNLAIDDRDDQIADLLTDVDQLKKQRDDLEEQVQLLKDEITQREDENEEITTRHLEEMELKTRLEEEHSLVITSLEHELNDVKLALNQLGRSAPAEGSDVVFKHAADSAGLAPRPSALRSETSCLPTHANCDTTATDTLYSDAEDVENQTLGHRRQSMLAGPKAGEFPNLQTMIRDLTGLLETNPATDKQSDFFGTRQPLQDRSNIEVLVPETPLTDKQLRPPTTVSSGGQSQWHRLCLRQIEETQRILYASQRALEIEKSTYYTGMNGY